MRHQILVIYLVAALASGCSEDQLPPPTETAARIESIREQIHALDTDLSPEPIDARVPLLEDTLSGIADRYGRVSVQMSQALTETVVVLARRQRFDLALPFMERALATTRDLYGLHHRETAFALHDLGVVLALIDEGNRSPRAELLFRGAHDLRSSLLGENHVETAASAAQLAWQLLLGARNDDWEPARASRLQEAERLALLARRALDAADDSSYRLQVRRIALEAAVALGEFDTAAARARELLAEGDYDPGPGLYPDATAFDLLLRALRAQDRDTEADALAAERRGDLRKQETLEAMMPE